jgi:hypothetical protein
VVIKRNSSTPGKVVCGAGCRGNGVLKVEAVPPHAMKAFEWRGSIAPHS